MKRLRSIIVLMLLQLSFVASALAGDFDWLNNLNVRAEADSSGFRYQLSSRFRVGDAEVKTVIGNVDRKADAYMVLRLSELSGKPVKKVLKVYRKKHKKGWGVIAKKLGIKPGSTEFHALKSGHDLGNGKGNGKGNAFGKEKGNSQGKGNGNGKGNGKDKGKGNK